MKSNSHLPHFITLGQRLYLLSNSNDPSLLLSEIPKFIQSLEECGLRRARTVAEPLKAISSIPYDHLGRVAPVAAGQIRAYAETVRHALYEEAGERTLITIDTGGVLGMLRDLPSTMQLTGAQQRLCDETVSCIERAAFRAAIVMGWNLAYDYIRQWVFDSHLAEFNGSLTAEYVRRDGRPVYEEIVAYEDFFGGSPSERVMIDTCFSATLFGERVRDNLRFFLRRRNDYAHPTFRSPTPEQTNAYVKDLLDIIAEPPFQIAISTSVVAAP